MTILFLTGGGDVGGAKTHILSLAGQLSARHRLHLAAFRPGIFAEEAVQAGLAVTVIHSGLVTRDFSLLLRLYDKLRPDVVHCHGAKANMMGALLSLRRKAAVMTTMHSDYQKDYLHSPLRQFVFGNINALSLRRMDGYAAVSDTLALQMIDRGFNPERIWPIVNGLDFSPLPEPVDRAAVLRDCGLSFREGDVVVCFAARLTAVKDGATLLRGFALAAGKCPALKLVVAGDGEQREELIRLSETLGIRDRVTFPGWLRDVRPLFEASDISALSSLSEGFPYSIVEGARSGCVLISTPVGGIPSFIRHDETGLLFPCGDERALSELLLRLASDKELRRRLGGEARKAAVSRFSLARMGEMQEEIYDTLLRRRVRPRRDGVVICGAYGRGNAGDDAILQAIIEEMREIDPDMPITVMTRRPAEARKNFRVGAVYTFDFPAFLHRMRRARLYLNGGGSLIQDATSRRSLYFYLYTLLAARRRGCLVMMYGCGIGPVTHPASRRHAAFAISRWADVVALRDEMSVRTLRELGVSGPEILSAADPALRLRPAEDARAAAVLTADGAEPDGPFLCFCLRDWKGGRHADAFARAAEYAYRTYGLSVLYLPAENPRDLAISEQAALATSTPCRVLRRAVSPDIFIRILSRSKGVLSMRLHALIFSVAAEIPAAGVSYDMKVEGFLRSMESSAFVPLDRADEASLCALVDRLASGEAEWNQTVRRRLEQAEQASQSAAARLLGLPAPTENGGNPL